MDLLVGQEPLVGEAAPWATGCTAGDDDGQSSSGTTTGRSGSTWKGEVCWLGCDFALNSSNLHSSNCVIYGDYIAFYCAYITTLTACVQHMYMCKCVGRGPLVGEGDTWATGCTAGDDDGQSSRDTSSSRDTTARGRGSTSRGTVITVCWLKMILCGGAWITVWPLLCTWYIDVRILVSTLCTYVCLAITHILFSSWKGPSIGDQCHGIRIVRTTIKKIYTAGAGAWGEGGG